MVLGFLIIADLPAALVAVVIAIAALGIWSSGDAHREELLDEIQKARERITVLEFPPWFCILSNIFRDTSILSSGTIATVSPGPCPTLSL